MLAKKDPVAMALYEKYNKLAMPNMRLNQQDATALISYIDEETQRLAGTPKQPNPGSSVTESFTLSREDPAGDVVAIKNAWVRETDSKAKVNAGYMTLLNAGPEEVTLVKVESESYEIIEVHEMAAVAGLMEMREVTDMIIPANGQIQLKPGGMHLILKKPRRHLTTGQKVDMTLTFKSGKKQWVSVQVAAR
jgi:hypothetical protein